MAETQKTTEATVKAMGYVNLDLFIDMSVGRWWSGWSTSGKSFRQYNTTPGCNFNPLISASSGCRNGCKSDDVYLYEDATHFRGGELRVLLFIAFPEAWEIR
jgi:hypothetical protein